MADPSFELSIQEKANRLYRGEALAPMVRASTTPLRILALHYGADFVYTEELVDRSLIESTRFVNEEMGTVDYNKDLAKFSEKKRKQILNGDVPPLLLRIDPKVERGKLVCQIGSGEPELASEAALKVYQDVDAIDINMGCPKKFSVSGGMGSALLSDKKRACAVVRAVCDVMHPKGLPVSAKIRLLSDVDSTIDFLSGLIEAGANAVAVHGRQRHDIPENPADWDSLRKVVIAFKQKYPYIPILVNGDFYTRDEFDEFRRTTGADGVLLARPALYNTSIFRKPEKTDSQATQEFGYQSILLLDKTKVVLDYLREVVRYGVHYKNTKYVVCEFMSNRRAPVPRTPYLSQVYSGGQTVAKVCNCHSMDAICKLWGFDESATDLCRSSKEQSDPHKYLDSYFLDHENEKPGGDTIDKVKQESPIAKRPKVETESEMTVA
ncbi:tRNA-dihydrouridine synthase 2 [Fistulifera solaris]|jgi:tRNA-dihydrouridine synthase 2|uniref:tRNA-dihydrouridine synthase 2 n=1 Tax=Fistulifera solaris TaxID=1519565 RepID=A0A1Z5JSD5_FISSO|nr:tRNA-dihydrouridine synthase 2 [Fistulifera solaris]|eukprot:GAX16859.1 tRNA-dihydrouridine synthase 2 [Fistulifera solaris]